MATSDMIAKFIRELLEDVEVCEIRRVELAEMFSCVPSQINYVLTSRFTPELGYAVESRRGGGGYIRIRRLPSAVDNMLMHVINSIGDTIDALTVRAMVDNLVRAEILRVSDGRLILAALSDSALARMPPELKDRLRASIIKNMLLSVTHRGTDE